MASRRMLPAAVSRTMAAACSTTSPPTVSPENSPGPVHRAMAAEG